MGKRILVVDDDELVRLALDELLTPEGYEIHTVSSGREALERIEALVYDLLMLDIIMPEMDGIEICKIIRKREDYSEVPIIFLTAKSREEDKTLGLEAGANLFLSKPIAPEKLLTLISETIG